MKFFFPPLPKSAMIHGQYYRGNCRNATLARWNAELDRFVYRRRKFNDTFLEEIQHCEDDTGFDVFFPTIVEENPEIEISFERYAQ